MAGNLNKKIACYQLLGKCFQELRYYQLAIRSFTRALQYAWKQNNVKYELQCYDFIGLQYYYLGDLKKAKYYHEKMMNGDREPKQSEMRKLGLTRLESKEKNM